MSEKCQKSVKKRMSIKSDFFGWYLYIPITEGSDQKAFKWVEIHDYWLLISQRHSEYPFLSINLGFVSLKPAPRNAIELKFIGFQGDSTFTFQTPNRFDILSFNKKLFSGIEAWKDHFSTAVREDIRSIDCVDYSSSVIGRDCNVTLDSLGIKIGSISQDSIFLQYSNIKVARAALYDNKYGCMFEIIDSQNKKYLLCCKSNKEMREIVSKIHYEMTISYNQAAISQGQQIPPNNMQFQQQPVYYQPFFIPTPPSPQQQQQQENILYSTQGFPIQAANLNSGYQYPIPVASPPQFFSFHSPIVNIQQQQPIQPQFFYQSGINMQIPQNYQVFPQQMPIQQQFISQNGQISSIQQPFQSQNQMPFSQYQMQSQQFQTSPYPQQFINQNIQQQLDNVQNDSQKPKQEIKTEQQTVQTIPIVVQSNIPINTQQQQQFPTNVQEFTEIPNQQQENNKEQVSNEFEEAPKQEISQQTVKENILTPISTINKQQESQSNESNEQIDDNSNIQTEQEIITDHDSNNKKEPEYDVNTAEKHDKTNEEEEESYEINDPFDEEEFI